MKARYVLLVELDFRHYITHTIAPLGFFLDWLLFDHSKQLRYSDARYWPIYPFLYWLFSVIQGASGVRS